MPAFWLSSTLPSSTSTGLPPVGATVSSTTGSLPSMQCPAVPIATVSPFWKM
jgi:hypothetical protein